ncbi:MAG: flagellar motor protein MotB [Lachnospiraceae bacterium]|nr:flagellar motor protein MotB [Lachnospiraceae bacterium]
MAKKKQEEAPKGSPAWMATFSDLMNLLLCFFVLLFSMSSVDAAKFEMVVASLKSSFSVLPAGGSSIEAGQLISSGVSQLENFSVFFERSEATQKPDEPGETEPQEAFEEEMLEEMEEMAEEIAKQVQQNGIQNQVEVDFNAQYVLLTLNGALLFDSGVDEIREDALPLIDKIGAILSNYDSNIIEIEGHTDNVPISNDRFPNNNVLSMFRALSVADHIRETTQLDPALIKSSGRGEYVPVADNTIPEGRARNRRVEIKIYNSYASQQ